MNGKVKNLLIILAVLIYVISPVDLLPGIPVDDIIVGLLGLVSVLRNNRLNQGRNGDD